MKWCEKMGAEMGALVLNRKLSASMKKLVKISTYFNTTPFFEFRKERAKRRETTQ